jgi:NAD(P)-dependent dehydrogenase (short-subunit alcohol dehydrogenase family)/acyl carrier protein
VCHARGLLAAAAETNHRGVSHQPMPEEVWPPVDAEAVEVLSLYDDLSRVGLEYGPTFQGLIAAWRRDKQIFAEVKLDERQAGEAANFGVHPALFDAALHAGLLEMIQAPEAALQLPFSLKGVRLHRRGASSLRVQMERVDEHECSIAAHDEHGAPVLSVDSLVARPVDAGKLRAARRVGRDSLFKLQWVEIPLGSEGVAPERLALLGDTAENLDRAIDCRYADLAALGEAIDCGGPVPEAVLVVATPKRSDEGDLAQRAHAEVRRMLELLHEWLACEQVLSSRLVLLTRGAVVVAEGERPDPAAACLWGLMRSAQSEHPGHFMLLDLSPDLDVAEIPWARLLASDESQLAMREGGVHAPRLMPLSSQPADSTASWDRGGTVLITGGTGGLGALVARHLAREHQVRHLLLVSRRGALAEGASELVDELSELGCATEVVACDVGDRSELSRTLDSIPAEHPLTGVIHAAGVLEDGLVESLDFEQFEAVMRPKVDAAAHLHDLTEGMELSDFVLFSSVAGVMGSPGQSNYAAANTFLDALAQHRRAQGLAGTSIAWGAWDQTAGMTMELQEAAMARLRRLGASAFSSEEGLKLFDAARGSEESLLVASRLDIAALRAQARTGALPPLLRGLVPVSAGRGGDGESSLSHRLAHVPEAERGALMLELVQKHVADVLGYDSPLKIDPEDKFKDLGFDSLVAVEMRNLLEHVTGLRLPATLAFDYPTPSSLAEYLLENVVVEGDQSPASADAELDRLERLLVSTDASSALKIKARLRAMLGGSDEGGEAERNTTVAQRVQSASADELLDFIDRELRSK